MRRLLCLITLALAAVTVYAQQTHDFRTDAETFPDSYWTGPGLPGACVQSQTLYFVPIRTTLVCDSNSHTWTQRSLLESKVSHLPAATLFPGLLVKVIDASGPTDCTIGGGTTVSMCAAIGGSYTAVGGSGSSGSFPPGTGVVMDNSGTGSAVTVSGDGTINPVTGVLTITKTAGAGFATIATSGSATDLSTGTLPHARLPTLLSGDIPANAANTSGNAATATALASAPTKCSAGSYTLGIDVGGNAQTCTAIPAPQFPTVSFSATPTFAATSTIADTFKLTLTGNVTSSTLTGAATGEVITWVIFQDGTGSRSYVAPTNIVGGCAISLAANTYTQISGKFDGTNVIVSSCFSNNSNVIPGAGTSLGLAATPFQFLSWYGSGTFGSNSFTLGGAPTGSETITPYGAGNSVIPQVKDCTSTFGQVVSKINSDGTVTCTAALGVPVFTGITNVAVANGTPDFVGLGGSSINIAENIRTSPMPAAGTLKGATVYIGGTQTASGALVCTWRKGATFAAMADTSVVVTIPASSTLASYSDSSDSFTFNLGDLVSIRCQQNTGGTSAGIVGIANMVYFQ